MVKGVFHVNHPAASPIVDQVFHVNHWLGLVNRVFHVNQWRRSLADAEAAEDLAQNLFDVDAAGYAPDCVGGLTQVFST